MKRKHKREAQRQRRWREKNPERAHANAKRWRDKNKELCKEAFRRWYIQNRERKCEKSRQWRKENPEHKRKLNRRWLEQNTKRHRELNRRWAKNNPEKQKQIRKNWRRSGSPKALNDKIARLLRRRLQSALRVQESRRSSSAVRDLGCSIEHLRGYLAGQFESGMNWKNHGRNGWHIDHIKPLASFDLSDPQQAKAAVHYTNLQPLWAADNIRKGAKQRFSDAIDTKNHRNFCQIDRASG